MKNNIEFLQNELIRISDWLKFTEQKFTFLSAYYGLWIAYISQNTKDIKKIFIESNYVNIFIFFLFIMTLILWIYFLFKVIFPNLKNISTNKSFFFFWHISSMKILDFIDEFKNLDTNEKEKQLLEQIHTNSVITYEKMNNIVYSFKVLFLNLILFLTLIFLLNKS